MKLTASDKTEIAMIPSEGMEAVLKVLDLCVALQEQGLLSCRPEAAPLLEARQKLEGARQVRVECRKLLRPSKAQ